MIRSSVSVRAKLSSAMDDAIRKVLEAKTIADAFCAVAHGRDVMIVGVPMSEAVDRARIVVQIAKKLQIPCKNVPHSECGPVVRVRSLDTPIPSPTPRQAVIIDFTASHERGSVREASVRTVLTLG